MLEQCGSYKENIFQILPSPGVYLNIIFLSQDHTLDIKMIKEKIILTE